MSNTFIKNKEEWDSLIDTDDEFQTLINIELGQSKSVYYSS